MSIDEERIGCCVMIKGQWNGGALGTTHFWAVEYDLTVEVKESSDEGMCVSVQKRCVVVVVVGVVEVVVVV